MSAYGIGLFEQHAKVLAGSGITPEQAHARGYRSVDTKARLERLSIAKKGQRVPGLLVPLLGVDGNVWGYQYRPDEPRLTNGKPVKYETPMGQRNGLDVPPGVSESLADPSVPLWITEGAKKGDAGALAGLCIVALTGVWNWRGTNDKGGKSTLADWHDVALNGRQVIIAFDGDAARKAAVNKAMRALADWLRTKDANPRFLHLPDEADKVGLDDFLQAGHTVDDLAALVRDEPPPLPADTFEKALPPKQIPDSPTRLDDAHLAEWMGRRALGEHWCWAGGLGWLRWDGKRWKSTNEAAVTEAIRRAVIALHEREAKAGASVRRLQDLDRLLSAARIKAIASLLRGFAQLDADRFDQRPDLLNVGNGVVDLRTGNLLPHDHRLLLTRITPVEYVPGATHPDWQQALTALPHEVAGWMQVRFGQAATGYATPDDLLPILQGGGSNGKSTLLAAARTALGGHAVHVPERVLTANPGDHPTELMTLFGARLAIIEETPEAAHVNVQRLKATIGTPTMVARRIRQDSVEWTSTHSLLLATNYRPRIDETDHGTWRRLALVVFPHTFPVSNLRQRIETNTDGQLQAVLAWIVEGARRWFAEGDPALTPPEQVASDTRAWRAEADRILAYLDDRITFDANACILAVDLLDDFNDWTRERGGREWSDQTLTERFGGHAEALARSVRKARDRRMPGLSQRNPLAPQPARAVVWFGIKFRDPNDLNEIHKSAGQSTLATGGHGVLSNPIEKPFTRVNQDPVATRGQLGNSPPDADPPSLLDADSRAPVADTEAPEPDDDRPTCSTPTCARRLGRADAAVGACKPCQRIAAANGGAA